MPTQPLPLSDPESSRALYLTLDTVARLSELAARFDAAEEHYDQVLVATRLIGVLHAAGLPVPPRPEDDR